MKIIKVPVLDSMLRLWEDANVFGEFCFQNYHRMNKTDQPLSNLKAQPGSEMSMKGVHLFRAICNYKSLRVLLEKNKEPINYYAFLPRVPKLLREDIGDDRELFAEMVEMGGVLLFPLFISKWMFGKKLFSVDEEAEIPFIPVQEGNYLNCLPYDDFMVRAENPFFEHFAGNPEVPLTFRTMMVSRKEKQIEILMIPDEIESFCNSAEERKEFEKLTILSRGKNENAYAKEKTHAVKLFTKNGDFDSFGNFSPEFIFVSRVIRVDIETGEYPSTNDGESDGVDNYSEFNVRWMATVSFLNGFSKIISEFRNVKGVRLEEAGDPYFGPRKNEDFTPDVHIDVEGNKLSWDEVTEGQIMHLISEKKDGRVSFIVKRGSEKCFHLRRRHERRYVKADNTVETIWVNACNVRFDKFQEGGKKSGISNVRE